MYVTVYCAARLIIAITHCMINVKRGQTMITTLKALICCETSPMHILLEAIDCILYGVTGMINPCKMVVENMSKSLSIKSFFPYNNLKLSLTVDLM